MSFIRQSNVCQQCGLKRRKYHLPQRCDCCGKSYKCDQPVCYYCQTIKANSCKKLTCSGCQGRYHDDCVAMSFKLKLNSVYKTPDCQCAMCNITKLN